MTSYTIRRAAKISTGNYENTDVEVIIQEEGLNGASRADEEMHIQTLFERADKALKKKIDEIELGKNAAKSKASRFGV